VQVPLLGIEVPPFRGTLADFEKLDIWVGTIRQVEDVPGSDKFGGARRLLR
jgi:tRNA-binding EMAP/Myf-like protein